MEKQIEKILIYLGAGTIITVAIGSLIINLSLSKFQLSDYNLLQPHAIAVGLTFLAWLVGHIFLLIMFVNLEDFKSNSRIKLARNTFVKFFLLLSCLFVLLGGLAYMNDPIWTLRIFSWKVNLSRITLIPPILFSTLYLVFYFDWVNEKKSLIYRAIYFMFIFSIIASIFNFIIYLNSPLYMDLISFEALVFGVFLFSSISIIESRKGIGSSHQGSWFSPTTSPTKKTISLTMTFAIFILLLSLIGIIRNYTLNIYPHIPQSLGGGKLQEIRYRTEHEVVVGKKFYETSESVFLLNGDSIRKLDWTEIKNVLPNIKSKNVRDTSEIPFIFK